MRCPSPAIEPAMYNTLLGGDLRLRPPVALPKNFPRVPTKNLHADSAYILCKSISGEPKDMGVGRK